MNLFQKLAVATVGVTLSLIETSVNPVQAASISYLFTQSNFSGGGTLSGSFSGMDKNGNGVLSIGELQTFNANFSGDTLVGEQTYPLFQDGNNFLAEFNFDIKDQTFLGRCGAFDCGLFAFNDTSRIDVSQINVSGVQRPQTIIASNGIESVSNSSVELVSVPEPEGAAGFAVLGLGGLLLQKKLVRSA